MVAAVGLLITVVELYRIHAFDPSHQNGADIGDGFGVTLGLGVTWVGLLTAIRYAIALHLVRRR